MVFSTKTRERMAAQIKTAGDKVKDSVLAVLGVAICAVIIAAAALFISVKTLRTVRA